MRGSFFVWKLGAIHVVQVNAMALTVPSGSWTLIGTVPQGYRPDREVRSVGYGGGKSFVIRLLTNGNLEVICDEAMSDIWTQGQLIYWV